MQNLVKEGEEGVTWPTFPNFGTSSYLGNGWS